MTSPIHEFGTPKSTEPEAAPVSKVLDFARESLIAYAIAQYPLYRASWHHRQIAAALERVERGEINRLMIFVPPRHGKSMLTSEFFPPWYLGRGPHRYIISSTYSEDLAQDWGRKVRNQMQDDIHEAIFPECSLSEDSRSSLKIQTMQGGAYFAVGVGGPITGRGAHLFLIDDPVKNREEADSENERRKLKEWYTSTAYTRLMPGGAIVVIQTRWHEDDLAGWLLREHAHENWTIIDLPALDEETESQPLWPEAYSFSDLTRIRSSIGPRDWSSLYMQKPAPAEGAEFKREWLRNYKTQRDNTNNYILVDPANSKGKKSDYTAMWVIGAGQDQNYYAKYFFRDRMNLAERTHRLFDLHRRYRPLRVFYESIGMQADVQHITSEQEHLNYRFAITALNNTKTAKADRIRRLIPLFEAQRIYLPESLHVTDYRGRIQDMVEVFIEQEYASFPVALHDDMFDSLSQLCHPEVVIQFPSADFNAPLIYDDTGIV